MLGAEGGRDGLGVFSACERSPAEHGSTAWVVNISDGQLTN